VRELEAILSSEREVYIQGRTLPENQSDSFCPEPPSQVDAAANIANEIPLQPASGGPGTGAELWKENASSASEINSRGSEHSPTEITYLHRATLTFEFHGQTSSLAFLDRLMKIKESNSDNGLGLHADPTGPIIHAFQNDALRMQREAPLATDDGVEQYYPHHAILFIDSYFKGLHYIYPIIDQAVFMERSYSLWAAPSKNHKRPIHQGFKQLYFAVLSLGALTRSWTEGSINGMDKHAWSSMLFEKAEAVIGRPGSMFNLEAVQTLIILAQVCQQQMNLNLAYTYLGLAVRTAFSSGMNRLVQFRDGSPQDSPSLVVSRTWHCLYCLETEVSFILGRPDILGLDSCHNRPPPPLSDQTEIIIVPAMLGLSRIMRQICKEVYLEMDLSTKVKNAESLELDLDQWLSLLPERIKPTPCSDTATGQPSFLPNHHYWPQLQMRVLKIRESHGCFRALGLVSNAPRSGYLHAKITLFYPFFLLQQGKGRMNSHSTEVSIYAQKCKESAVELIKSIHATYCLHHFCRSW
jgi:hypothetical protein